MSEEQRLTLSDQMSLSALQGQVKAISDTFTARLTRLEKLIEDRLPQPPQQQQAQQSQQGAQQPQQAEQLQPQADNVQLQSLQIVLGATLRAHSDHAALASAKVLLKTKLPEATLDIDRKAQPNAWVRCAFAVDEAGKSLSVEQVKELVVSLCGIQLAEKALKIDAKNFALPLGAEWTCKVLRAGWVELYQSQDPYNCYDADNAPKPNAGPAQPYLRLLIAYFQLTSFGSVNYAAMASHLAKYLVLPSNTSKSYRELMCVRNQAAWTKWCEENIADATVGTKASINKRTGDSYTSDFLTEFEEPILPFDVQVATLRTPTTVPSPSCDISAHLRRSDGSWTNITVAVDTKAQADFISTSLAMQAGLDIDGSTSAMCWALCQR
jgi:hypothetical protein